MGSLVGLFASAFLSATLLPGSSEAALAAAVTLTDHPPPLLIAVVTIGNVLGSCVNWLLGRLVSAGHVLRLPVSGARLGRFEAFYYRFGIWSLLLSWVPILGDPLTVLAGLARTPLILFVPLVTIGKLARYLAVAGLVGLGG
jgi:membrane protein YqaA with SNARE-associated domain